MEELAKDLRQSHRSMRQGQETEKPWTGRRKWCVETGDGGEEERGAAW